ncbi:DNA-directed RNA polymerase subunit A' [uncultured Methanobrevibacter sp.]|uniref:DNA-directed RNA polymerase subunit A' n=1 Tax=uncultured Methanobrevibacter sp. TaxID=253161 RepID=UPI0025CCB4D9|nr:DNA-directed RNA polymerase subunit A' [uncultured Methanobrevibacter sp.]
MKGIIKKIDRIDFGLMSPEQIREMSVVKIERPDTYDEDGYPIESGLMDSRLGVIDPSLKCRTCGEKGGECQGHFGMIELARPVIHVGFGDDIHKILRSTCSECGRVLLDDDEIEEYTEKMEELQEAGESVEELVKEVYKICKDKKTKEVCPHCGAEQEDIKIVKPIDIIEVRKQYDENGELMTEEDGTPITEDYDLTASEVREKLQRIPDEDAYVLGVNPEVARPEWMVLTVLPVPPVTVRPSITLDTGERSEDDLTHKLVDILRINQRLIENMDAGAPQLIVEDLWKLLQYHVTTYFDNEASGVPPARHRSGRPLKTLAQRLKGKEGRFRSNLSGKRVNFSARTVISPDPNISINEVGVPEMIAKEVTVPTYVNEWNIEELKEAILNGPNVHPGANYVKKTINGKEMKVRVLDDNRELVVENLEYGDVVMRHLKDGDIVLFNRQPSLHRMSMMAHEVRVLPYKTFRLNLCVCPPYNADFDGDEMNMHVFQTDESRAEAKSLMRVQEHILSPRFGGPIIGAIHDHISGAYLLTRDGFTVPEDDAFQMIRKSHLLNNEYVDKKHLKRKNRDWTGKELFSLLLPDDLNMNYKAEICRKCETCLKEDCQYDAFVVIKDGQLTHGAIDEAAYGSFSGKILDTIVKEYGPSRAKEFLDRSTDLAICGIMKTGITTGTNDEEIPEEAIEVIDAHLDKAEQEVDKLIATYEEGLLQPLPGRSAEETLEMRIVQVLGEARDTAGEIAEGYLTMGKQSQDDSYDYVMAVENHSVVMARTGARASMLNLAQITACVGQQSVRGGRITRGYLARPLPHFRKHELGARAKGFVHSSYKEGLDPVEFFFHAMGGREGLVDTAIRTAQSGYMQRRLVNALEDLNVRSDGLVTDNKGQVIQSVFGEEGIDPAKSDFGHVANLDKLIDEMRIKDN